MLVKRSVPLSLSTKKKAYYAKPKPKPKLSAVTKIHPIEFYNREGEAVMIPYTREELDVSKLRVSDPPETDQQRKDRLNYQSWLHSFTFFGEDPLLTRVVVRRGMKPNGKKERNLVVGKVWVTTLMPHETFEEGNYADTKALCIKKLELSRKEREANDNDVGKLKLVNALPPSWESSMSTQKPLEGYEDRCRTPALVELLFKGYTHSPSRHIRKFVERTAANDEDISTPPVKVKRPLEVLMQKELAILQDKLAKNRYDANPLPAPNDDQYIARYTSWLRAPKVMGVSLLTDGYITSYSDKQLKLFKQVIENIEQKWKQFANYNYPTRQSVMKIGESLYRYDNWLRGNNPWSPKGRRFILIGEPYGDPKRKLSIRESKNIDIPLGLPKPSQGQSISAERIGLDVMPPMTELEYDHITRIRPNSVDKHLYDLGLISLGQCCTGNAANEMAGLLIETKLHKGSYAINRLKTEYVYFDKLFWSVSQVVLKALQQTSVQDNPESPAIITVDDDVKKPDKVSRQDKDLLEKSNVITTSSKAVLRWFIKMYDKIN